jgi:hypothetical protein
MSINEQIAIVFYGCVTVFSVSYYFRNSIRDLWHAWRLSKIHAMKTGRYVLQSKIFNNSEYYLHRELVKQFGWAYLIYAKIRVEDFIQCAVPESANKQANWSLRGKIKSRHVDFLICSLEGTPIYAIELDGKSHDNSIRKDRDNFLDSVYQEVGLPYTHILVWSNFASEVSKVLQKIKK